MKKNKLLSIILGISGLATVSSAAAVSLSSCSSSTTSNDSITIPQVSKTEFNPLKSINQRSVDNNILLEVDPNTNEDALNQGYSILEKMNIQTWQSEFDRSLTKFYKAYEFETKIKQSKKSNKLEIESEVKKINVTNVDRDANNKNIKLSLDVTYEVEIESNKEDEKKLEVVKKEVTFSPSFATLPELKNIAKQLKELDKNNSGNKNIDFDDILELYVGDPEDNKRSIFEQVYDLANNLKFGGLLGVNVNVSDLEYNPLVSTYASTDVANGVMFAPILSSSKFFQPAIDKASLKNLSPEEFAILKPIIDKIDISYDKLSVITKQEFIDGFKIPSATLPGVDDNLGNDQPVNPDESDGNDNNNDNNNPITPNPTPSPDTSNPGVDQNPPAVDNSNDNITQHLEQQPPKDETNDSSTIQPTDPSPIEIPSYVSYINNILLTPLFDNELQYIRVIYVDTSSNSKNRNVTIVLTTKPGTFNSKTLLEDEKLVCLQFEYLDNWFKTTSNSNK
ncbi:MAG: hypothetical protein K2H80_01185 [Ureaplasma sp.]|nr:hypothetical protein [Ureaplasma sp.]